MSAVTELVNWRGALVDNTAMAPVRAQYNFGPFEVGGFDRLLLRQRSLMRPTDGLYVTPSMRIGVASGPSPAIGSGLDGEPILELSGLAGYPDPETFASTAERLISINAGATPEPELRWAVPIDAPYVMIGIAGPSGQSDSAPIALEIHAVVGGTDKTHPHQYGTLNLLDVEQLIGNNSTLEFRLPPFGGAVAYDFTTTSTDLQLLLAVQDFDGATAWNRTLLASPATAASGVLTLPWKNTQLIALSGAAGLGALSLHVTEQR